MRRNSSLTSLISYHSGSSSSSSSGCLIWRVRANRVVLRPAHDRAGRAGVTGITRVVKNGSVSLQRLASDEALG